jgi:hypothetical protein
MELERKTNNDETHTCVLARSPLSASSVPSSRVCIYWSAAALRDGRGLLLAANAPPATTVSWLRLRDGAAPDGDTLVMVERLSSLSSWTRVANERPQVLHAHLCNERRPVRCMTTCCRS